MKKIFIEFNWKGENISKFIEYNDMFEEVNNVDVHFYDIINNEKLFTFRINWALGIILIYKNDKSSYVDSVDNFNVRFCERY